MHYIFTPEAQILVCFALRPAGSKISHILLFPIDYHVKRQKKNHNWISLNNFGRDPPQEYVWFVGSESDVYFQRYRLKFFLPYGPVLTKRNKNRKKIKKIKSKIKKKMVWRYGG